MKRLLGPQGAAAVVLCGEPLDGEAAVARGLAWKCVEDDALLDEAIRLARHAAATPPELAKRLKATLRGMSAVTDHGEAVRLELEQQLWSLEQDEFNERLAKLKARISGKKCRDKNQGTGTKLPVPIFVPAIHCQSPFFQRNIPPITDPDRSFA